MISKQDHNHPNIQQRLKENLERLPVRQTDIDSERDPFHQVYWQEKDYASDHVDTLLLPDPTFRENIFPWYLDQKSG